MPEETEQQYNIFDLGFNKFLIKGSSALESEIERVADDLPLPSILGSGFYEISPGQIGSGDMVQNMTLVAGLLQSSNFVTGSSGWRILYDGTVEFNSGTFRGTLVAASIHIPDENTTANSFHADSDGNAWWGCTHTNFDADNDNALAYILKTGVAKFQSITIVDATVTGGIIQTSISGQRVVIASDALDFYDSNGNRVLTVGISGSTTQEIKPVADTTALLIQSAAGTVLTNRLVEIDALNASSSGSTLYVSHAGSGIALEVVQTATGIGAQITATGGVPSLKVISSSDSISAPGLLIDKNNSGYALDIDMDANNASAMVGLKMNIANAGAGLEYAFKFEGSEYIPGATGLGSVTGMIRIVTSDGETYIPVYDSYS